MPDVPEAGLHYYMVHMLDELKHYNVKIPANCSHDMYKDEYILPFWLPWQTLDP